MGAFEVQKGKRDLDPEVVLLVRRVTLLRRQLEKFPDLEEKVKMVIKRYKEVKESGGAEFANVSNEDDEEEFL